MQRKNKLNTIRTADGIKLVEEKYQNNPFDTWKKEFDQAGKESMLIASIPFVRNIAEYSGYTNNFLKLTSLLHIKEDTKTVTVANLQVIYKDILKDKNTLVLSNPAKIMLDLTYEVADIILNDASEIIELENKIVLAVAIRLKSEEFMIAKISDDTFWKGITSNQTSILIKRYKHDFSGETINIELLEQVNLMTPENIHLNSFMYEPILDMSNDHLKQLYQDVKKLK